MDWNSTRMPWLLLLGFLAVLVSSQHYPKESMGSNRHITSLLDLLILGQLSTEGNEKGHSSWETHGAGTFPSRQSISEPFTISRTQRPVILRLLPTRSSKSGQLSSVVPLSRHSNSGHPPGFRMLETSSSSMSELTLSGLVELTVTKAKRPGAMSIAVASISGPVEQIMTKSSRVFSSPSSLEPRKSVDGLMSNENPRTEKYEKSPSFLHNITSYKTGTNTSITPGDPITSEYNTSGSTRKPSGILPVLTVIPASPAETKGPTPTQVSISVSPMMEGPVKVGDPPDGSSDTAEESTSLYLSLAPGDFGNAISTATLESASSTPASTTLESAELSSPAVPKLPFLVTLYPKETETPTHELSGQPESESSPTGRTSPSLIQNKSPLSDATVSSVNSGSGGPSTLSSLSTLSLPSPTLYSSSLSSSLLLPSPSSLVLNTIQSTTYGIPKDSSVSTSMSTSTESSINTSSLEFFHITTHQQGLKLTPTEPTRVSPYGSTPNGASLAPGANTLGLTVISDTTSMLNSSSSSLVSLENFSSTLSDSSPSTPPSVHVTDAPSITPYLFGSHPSMTESVDSSWSPTSIGMELSVPSPSSPLAQHPFLLDSVPPSLGYNHMTRPLTFKITNEIFTAAFYDPTSLEYRLLSENVQNQLTPIYQRAFSSFDRVEVNGFRHGSVVVNTTIVFGNKTRVPSPMDIVWVLYREVKGVGMMLGNLSLAENSIQSEASTLTTLAPLTVHVSLTTMEPFVSSLLRPGSATYTTLEGQTMGPVTPVVLGFYGMHPQERPLLLFSNDDQWVGVTIVYKFNVPIPAGLRGLADRLAREVTDTHIQKSSISVNEEKAELTVYDVWLQIPSWTFTEALKDKASSESRELRGKLTRGLTTILKPTRNFAEVIVEEFLPSPMTARVRPTYFSAAPSEADVQEWVSQGLGTLKDTEGLYVKLMIPGFDLPSSRPSTLPKASFPSYAVVIIVLGLLILLVVPLVLVLALRTNTCSQIAGLCVWKPRYGRQVTTSEYTMHSYDLKH